MSYSQHLFEPWLLNDPWQGGMNSIRRWYDRRPNRRVDVQRPGLLHFHKNRDEIWCGTLSIRVHLTTWFNSTQYPRSVLGYRSLAPQYQANQVDELWGQTIILALSKVPQFHRLMHAKAVPGHPISWFEARRARYPGQPPFVPALLCKSEARIASRWGRHVSVNIMDHLSVHGMPGNFVVAGIMMHAEAQKAVVNAPRRIFNITSLPVEVFETILFYSAELRINMLAQTTTAAHPRDQWCYQSFAPSERECLHAMRFPMCLWAAITSIPEFHVSKYWRSCLLQRIWLSFRFQTVKDGAWNWNYNALIKWAYSLEKVVCISARWNPEEDGILVPTTSAGYWGPQQPKAMWQIGSLNPRGLLPSLPSPAEPFRLSSISDDVRRCMTFGDASTFEKAMPVPTPPWWADSQLKYNRPSVVSHTLYPFEERNIPGVGLRPLKPHVLGHFGFLQINAVWSISKRKLVTPVTTLLNMLPDTECCAVMIVIKMADGNREFRRMSPKDQATRASSMYLSAMEAVATQVGLFFNIIASSVAFERTGILPGHCPLVNCATSRGRYWPGCSHADAEILRWIPPVYIKLDPILE